MPLSTRQRVSQLLGTDTHDMSPEIRALSRPLPVLMIEHVQAASGMPNQARKVGVMHKSGCLCDTCYVQMKSLCCPPTEPTKRQGSMTTPLRDLDMSQDPAYMSP